MNAEPMTGAGPMKGAGPTTSTGPVSWHPPQQVLELVELVLAGALPALPGSVPLPIGPGSRVEDAEGAPVAVLDAAGRLAPAQPFGHPPLRSQRRTVEQVTAELAELPGDGPVLAVPVTGPLPAEAVEGVLTAAAAAGARLLWLVVFGAGRRGPLRPEALLRAVRRLASNTGQAGQAGLSGVVLPVAVPDLDGKPDLVHQVARGYGADRVLATAPALAGRAAHPAFGAELARTAAARRPDRRGVTVFLTGLSGSGKSTIAKRFAELLLDDGRRTVTLLDGDEVRRMLSRGLGFTPADRELNILRIGFVAAEVTRHGGVAVCAPIAPFAAVRDQVREAVELVGDLVLVHVATPLAECERRDRKGLYARARRGEIGDFTGISSPYEEPLDADLRIDTSGRALADCVAELWRLFERRGYLGSDPSPADRAT